MTVTRRIFATADAAGAPRSVNIGIKIFMKKYNVTLMTVMNYVALTYSYMGNRGEIFMELLEKCKCGLKTLKMYLDELDNIDNVGDFDDLCYDYVRYYALKWEVHYMENGGVRTFRELRRMMKNVETGDDKLTKMIRDSYEDDEEVPENFEGFQPFQMEIGDGINDTEE